MAKRLFRSALCLTMIAYFRGECPLAESTPCMPGAGATAFGGAHTVADVRKRVENDDISGVRHPLYLRAQATMDDHVTRTEAWQRGVAEEMLRERGRHNA